MDETNFTRISIFHFIGFHDTKSLTFLIFVLFLMIYCVTICGNLLIVIVVFYSKILHSPMYFFLSQLSASDILLATDIVPNMLHLVLMQETNISFAGCMAQFYFFCLSETSECLILTVMCYDRFLAICKPLHYALIMNRQLCRVMVISIWTSSFLTGLFPTITISNLQFCGPNAIDHFFCDLGPILRLSCSDTNFIQLEVTLLNAVFVAVPFFIIIVSYAYIIFTIFEIPSITGRQKAFSTCSSHLMIISIYYGTLVCVYLIPSGGESFSKFISLLYTVLTPLLNPIIYSLRNKELKRAVIKPLDTFLNMLL